MTKRKLKIVKVTHKKHYRHGWQLVRHAVMKQLHHPKGTFFSDWVDEHFQQRRKFDRPWVGYLHSAVTRPKDYPHRYKNALCLELLVGMPWWQDSLPYCKGLFTPCRHTTAFLQAHVPCPVETLLRPVPEVTEQFSLEAYEANTEKKLVFIGQQQRRYQSFYEVDAPSLQKVLLRSSASYNLDYVMISDYARRKRGTVLFRGFLPSRHYDHCLTRNIVFLDLYDVSCSNVVLECIACNTPILVRRMPATVDYLGEDYPFFFTDIEEAGEKLKDQSLVAKTHAYLRQMKKVVVKDFVTNLAASGIYQGLRPTQCRLI